MPNRTEESERLIYDAWCNLTDAFYPDNASRRFFLKCEAYVDYKRRITPILMVVK